MQHGQEAWTCSMHMQHEHAAWTCNMNMQRPEHGHKAQIRTDMQHGHAARTNSMEKLHGNMQQGHAYTLLKNLLFTLPSGYELCNWVSSVVR
jgi:hypothetical protein